jgi:hypothetical protein
MKEIGGVGPWNFLNTYPFSTGSNPMQVEGEAVGQEVPTIHIRTFLIF